MPNSNPICNECQRYRRASGRTEPALTEKRLPGAGDWVRCYCCGRSYLADHMVRFHDHPDDALCVGCVAWLHDRSRPVVRRLYPIWQLPALIRARRTRDRLLPTHLRTRLLDEIGG